MELAEKTIRAQPDEGGIMSFAGWVNCLSGNLEQGHFLLGKSARLLKRPWWTIFEWRGVCHLVSNEHQEALAALERACTLAADPSFSHALRAMAYIELGEPRNASLAMRNALTESS